MSENLSGIYNATVPAVMLHPHLFEAQAYKDQRTGKVLGEPKYGAQIMLAADNADFLRMKALAGELAKSKFPGASFATLQFPFASGTKAADKRAEAQRLKSPPRPADGEFMRGNVLIAARSKFPPKIGYIEGGRVVDLEVGSAAWTASKSKFYFGAEVLYQVNLVTFDISAIERGDRVDNRGVSAYLNMVLATGKGTRIGGGAPPSDVFKGYVGGYSAESVLPGKDDEIPL